MCLPVATKEIILWELVMCKFYMVYQGVIYNNNDKTNVYQRQKGIIQIFSYKKQFYGYPDSIKLNIQLCKFTK